MTTTFMNSNMERWIHASICTYFNDFLKQTPLPLYIEAQDRQTAGLKDWAELRWDGPYVKPKTRNLCQYDIEINIIVSSIIGRNDTHQHKKSVGIIQSAIPIDLLVKKYGDSEIDTGDYVGCFQLKSEDRDAIITSYFGKIETDVVLEQSTVEAHYRMQLKQVSQ